MKKLKLYIWEYVFQDYTSGLAFAIASNKQEAAKLALGKDAWMDWKVKELEDTEPKILPLNKPYGNYRNGGG
jgi:hypothetical protein